MNPTRLLRSLLSERLGQTAGRWPREMFGEMDAPTLRQAIAERVNPSPQSVIEPPAPTRIQPDAGGAREGFDTGRVVRRTIDAPHARGYGEGNFEILQNPTVAQIDRFVAREMRDPANWWVRDARRFPGSDPKQYYPLRYLQDADGNIYISSGVNVEHSHMAQGLRARGVNLGNDPIRSEFGSGQLQYRDGKWVFERGSETTGGDFAVSRQIFEPLDPSYPNVRASDAPNAGSGGAGQEGFNFDEPLYHGTSGAIEGEFIPSRGLELGNGVYVTPDAEFASQHATKHNQGGAVVPLYARQGRYATGEQYRNALDNVGNGRNHDATQAYLESRGYIGVRDGREIVVFRPENLTFRTQSPDGGSAQTGRSLADRVLNVEPAPMQRDGNILRLQDDRGSLQARALDGDSVLRVDSLGIAQGSRGTLGPRVLRALLDEADRTGRVLVSDTRLSADAVRAVESLRRLGLTVTKNPSVTIMPTGSHVAGDFAPLYSITRGPVEWADVQRAYFEPNVRVRAQPNAGGGRNGNGGTVAALTALPAGALTLRELLRDRYGAA